MESRDNFGEFRAHIWIVFPASGDEFGPIECFVKNVGVRERRGRRRGVERGAVLFMRDLVGRGKE